MMLFVNRLVGMALALLLASCGGSNNSSNGASSDQSLESETVKPESSNALVASQINWHTLADFEEGQNTVVRPAETNPLYRFLWWEYGNGRSGGMEREGEVSMVADAAYSGKFGLKNTITAIHAGNTISQLHFYPYSSTGYSYRYARELSKTADWKLNTYNRLRFFIKLPEGMQVRDASQDNLHFGTYIRASTAPTNSAESENGHYYHYFNIPYTGQWHQVIVDWHPNHQRGANGSTEHGEKAQPTQEEEYNYFDLLTRFYIQPDGAPANFPVEILLDDVQLYQETADENTAEVYSLHGTYIPNENRLLVGWMRDKRNNEAMHEVRYAFSDIHVLGWEKAMPAPDGAFLPVKGHNGYNGVRYESTQINMDKHEYVFVAIKPQGSEKYRQIVIRLR